MSPNLEDPIVADGRGRAFSGSIDQVRAEVEQEFSAALCTAGFWRRIWLRFRIHREVRKRMRHAAPPWGLYSHSGARSEGRPDGKS